VAPEGLELEITESVIMFDPGRALQILTQLSHMGIALSIDDFGTGYSSLSYLKKLPVNAVKIDKSFVLHMTDDPNDAQIVRSTIELAHNLGLKVIAEGVETREVWDQLLALGCDEGQGYYMSRPLPAPEMTQWLNQPEWGPAKSVPKMILHGALQSKEW
jgi:EAL domain-containing protein (putative c-di-GMP-specific phosphodiesterase class I)